MASPASKTFACFVSHPCLSMVETNSLFISKKKKKGGPVFYRERNRNFSFQNWPRRDCQREDLQQWDSLKQLIHHHWETFFFSVTSGLVYPAQSFVEKRELEKEK